MTSRVELLILTSFSLFTLSKWASCLLVKQTPTLAMISFPSVIAVLLAGTADNFKACQCIIPTISLCRPFAAGMGLCSVVVVCVFIHILLDNIH